MLKEVLQSLFQWVLRSPRRIKDWLWAAPGRLIKWLKDDAARRERWGYFWWGLAGVVIAVPELWAAVGGEDVLWPTISGTVANLEVSHVWVALIVVGLLIWAALHVIGVTREKLRGRAPRASVGAQQGKRLVEGDRFTVAPVTREVNPLQYLLFAVGAVAIPSVLFHELYHGEDSRYVFGEVMYASIGLWWMIIPGWVAYKRGFLVPYPTLFRTLQDLEKRAPKLTVLLASGITILMVHLILYPWPSSIPDTSRLHLQYKCHPLQPVKKPLRAGERKACDKLDQAEVRPPAGTP